jgi:putative phosphoribosyl transferase
MLFRDRTDAGQRLARALQPLAGDMPIVAALPRGGVPVAVPVAAALGVPVELLMVRKLGVPGHEEYAFGALGEDGTRVIDEFTVQRLGLTPDAIERVVENERRELQRRSNAYGVRPASDYRDRTVVIVDDGIATGSTMQAAVEVAHHRGARRVVVAVPVGAQEACDALGANAEVVALEVPSYFGAVGAFYDTFDQVSDAEVVSALN